jgi:O-antigen ligase
MTGYGIWDFFVRGGTFFSYQIRAGSLHSGFGTFSTYLITVMPYILLALFFVPAQRIHWGLSLLFFINLGALFLTHARGAWVAAALLIGGAGWMFLSRRAFLSLIIGGGAIFFLFLFQGSWQHYVHFTPPNSQGKIAIETGAARWELLKFTLDQIKENPFQMIGYGRGSFVKKYREFSDQYKGALLWHAHNTFLNVALQTGIQGLVIFLLLVYQILAYSYRQGKDAEAPGARYFLLSTFFMVALYFVRNLSDDFFVDDSALLFWLLVGVAVRISPGEPAVAYQTGFPGKFRREANPEIEKEGGALPAEEHGKGPADRSFLHGDRLFLTNPVRSWGGR